MLDYKGKPVHISTATIYGAYGNLQVSYLVILGWPVQHQIQPLLQRGHHLMVVLGDHLYRYQR